MGLGSTPSTDAMKGAVLSQPTQEVTFLRASKKDPVRV